MKQTVLSLLVDNTSGVLSRVSGMFSRRGYNIDSLSVGITENPKYSRMTVAVTGDERIITQIKKTMLQIKTEERKHLLDVLKHFTLTVTGLRGFDEAIITGGGISVKEINPQTMEIKKIKNLRVAGEIIDCDALTGGFNLQIAWSTAYMAAQ